LAGDASNNRATQEAPVEPAKNIIKTVAAELDIDYQAAKRVVEAVCDAVIAGVIAHGVVWFGAAGRFALRSITNSRGHRVPSVTFWSGPLFQERLQGGPALDPEFTAKLPPAPRSRSAQLRDEVLAAAAALFAGEGPDPAKLEALRAKVERLDEHMNSPHPEVPA
jgi:hypothetical protein